MHPNEWPVVASSDLLYITDADVFEDDPSTSKRTAGCHECPEQYDERTCWSTSDSFVLFLTLPALLIHFLFLLTSYWLHFSFSVWLQSRVVIYLFLASIINELALFLSLSLFSGAISQIISQ